MKGNLFKIILALFIVVFMVNLTYATVEKVNEKTVIAYDADIDLCVDVQILITENVSSNNDRGESIGFLYDRQSIKLNIYTTQLKDCLYYSNFTKYRATLTNNNYYNNKRLKYLRKEIVLQQIQIIG